MATRSRPRRTTAKRYRIHVELAEIEPVIWRKVWVEGHMSLRQLHHIIQAAMGWTSSHLHEFRIGSTHYAEPDPDFDLPERSIIDDRSVFVGDVLRQGLRFEYIYDFGDDWVHHVHVEKTEAMDEPTGAAAVVDGARACPPEDCGGSSGYQPFLDRLASAPQHKEVKTFRKWAGGDFDPDRFDRRAADAALLRMAWNGWGEVPPPKGL